MSVPYPTKNMRKLFAFPFAEPGWAGKFLIGLGICFVGSIIPILPWLILCGYYYRIMRQVIVDKEDAHLPAWEDWGGLLKDGWRWFSVGFIYSLPATIISLVGVVMYFGMIVFSIQAQEGSGEFPVMMIVAMIVMFLSLTVAMILYGLLAFILPPALCHTVAKGTFKAGFDFSGWWKSCARTWAGFFVTVVIVAGLYTVIMFAGYIFYMTIILCWLFFIIMFIGGYYMGLVSSALLASVYREGVEKIEIVTPAPAPLASKPAATRKPRTASKVS